MELQNRGTGWGLLLRLITNSVKACIKRVRQMFNAALWDTGDLNETRQPPTWEEDLADKHYEALNFIKAQETRLKILLNLGLVTPSNIDYVELEIFFRELISNWKIHGGSLYTRIAEDHKEDIANYISSHWIQRRRCVSVEILQKRLLWVPLVATVFRMESVEDKNRIVEFFRKSVSQRANMLQPILMLIIGVHDNHCNCRLAPRPLVQFNRFQY